MGKEKKEKKDKKVKKVKQRIAYCQSETYSKRYSYLFNNKLMSDINIKFEKSGNIIHCHKLVLTCTSECKYFFF
jgi:hypothetical protein